jgi:hypothetical protein
MLEIGGYRGGLLKSRNESRWRSGAREESLLVSGLSLGEGIAIALTLGILLTLALTRYRAGLTHTAVSEVLGLSSAVRLAWIEQWAVEGRLPVSNGALSAPAPRETLRMLAGLSRPPNGDLSQYVHALDETATDGQIVFWLRNQNPQARPLIVQFRPAFGPGAIPATVLWLCGRAKLPAGFVRVGADLTTLTNAELPSACRGRT